MLALISHVFASEEKPEDVSAIFDGHKTYRDREGYLWRDIDKKQRVIYTDYSGRSSGKSAIGIVWGWYEHQSEASFLNVSSNLFY